jgi:hypothetical protein
MRSEALAALVLVTSCAKAPTLVPVLPVSDPHVLMVPVYGAGKLLLHAVGLITTEDFPAVVCLNSEGILYCVLGQETGTAMLQIDSEGYQGYSAWFTLPSGNVHAPAVVLEKAQWVVPRTIAES